MMYLGLSIFVNIILIIYLIYIYLIKGELRKNKNVEYNNVEYNETVPDSPAQFLSEIERLNEEIATLKFTHQDLIRTSNIIRNGMDLLTQKAV